jgi:hypothetical protein
VIVSAEGLRGYLVPIGFEEFVKEAHGYFEGKRFCR